MTQNVLNLDDLSEAKRHVTLDEVKHNVKDLTVADFIELTQQAETLEAEKKELSTSEQIAETAKLVARYVPTLSVERLMKLNMMQLTAVVKFVRGEMDKKAIDTLAGEAGKE